MLTLSPAPHAILGSEKTLKCAFAPPRTVVISGPATSANQEFVDTLPSSRWDRVRLCWTADLTPASAWRIANPPEGVQFSEVAPEVASLAQRFAESLADHGSAQPERRRPGVELRPYQAAEYQFAVHREAALHDVYMGLGKSLVAVHLVANTRAKRALIICPASVLGVWRREFRKWWPDPDHPPALMVLDKKSWTVARKTVAVRQHLEMAQANNQPAVVVINYESVWREEFAKLALATQWDMAVCDESQRIKNPDSKSSKFCAKLAKVSKRRDCLSGTPLPHSPLDAFAQFRFLDPGIFGTSWARFRDRYGIPGAFGADHIVGYKNKEELARKMALLTFHAGEEHLAGLPPMTESYREDTLNSAAAKIYQSLEQELIAEAQGGVITATNALVKLLRLQQITSGYCVFEQIDKTTGATTGEQVVQNLGTEKIDLLAELLGDLPPGEPVVVFCRFREDLDRIQQVVEAGGKVYGEISGRRKDLTPESTMPAGIDVMGVQIQSGGVGIDLTRACYVVYYSVGYSLGDYLQSLKRCHRHGQTRPTFVYHLVLRGTVDEAVYAALEKRADIIAEVLAYLQNGGTLDPAAVL